MNSYPSRVRTFCAVAAVAALLAACGDSDNGTAVSAASDTDDADPRSLARVTEIMASADSEIRNLRVAGAGAGAMDGPAAAELLDGSSKSLPFFPGVKQTNLVANKPGFGARIIEPDLKNAWGIAIRPAGFGGHFWVGAAVTGKSIQYVGDVGDTPLFQDELKVVDTLGPATGVAFNHGTQFVITQPHPNGEITNSTKFFFANASGTITAWTERARPQGGFDHPADSVVVVDGTARRASFLGVTVTPAADRLFAADFGAEAALRV